MTPNSQFLIPNSKSDLTSLVFRSAEEVACDECAASLAAAMGDLDPFAYPSDTADTAVMGVSAYGVDLAALNAKNRQFGLPIVVNTNLDEAVLIRLDVNVLLRGGRIRLSVEDATAPLEVWGPSSIRGEWVKFADADTSLDVTMAEWRRMTGHADDGSVPSVNVRLLVPHVGKATLVLHYWNVVDSEFVEDEARQRVTAVNPRFSRT